MLETTSCTIRRLQHADVHCILNILRGVRAEYGLAARLDSLLEPADFTLFEGYRRRRCAYFVAIEDGQVAGGAGIAPLAHGDWRTCELQRMYLRSSSRGSGIGQNLLDACIAAAQAFDFTRLYAETLADMQRALAFYDRNDFVRLDAPLGATGHAHNDCWLLRPLAPAGASALC